MRRREFLRSSISLASLGHFAPLLASTESTQIAFTFDDPTVETRANLAWREINDRMLSALAERHRRSVLFVCGKRIDNPAGRELIAAWDRKGHLVANHSYSHLSLNDEKVSLQTFEADALKNEPLIRNYSHFTPLFRYPFFKEGDTVEKRDGMRSFLQQYATAWAAPPSTLPTGPSVRDSKPGPPRVLTRISRLIVIFFLSTSGGVRNSTTPSPNVSLLARCATPCSCTTTR